MSSEPVLVTGGGGFIGSHLCDSLLEDGAEVFCLDNFCSSRHKNVDRLLDHPRFTLIEADLLDEPELPPVDKIYHLASRASPPEFTEYPVHIAMTNTVGTRYLLEHAVEHGARLVFASTSEVYGEPEVHPQSEDYSGNVNIRGPRSCYDESKRFGETLTIAYERQYDLDVRTVRIFNTYGPRMRADDGRVIPNFLTQAMAGEDLTIYGDGSQTRSFCYVDDTVAGFRKLMDADGLDGEVVNIGQENEITIAELAEIIRDVCRSSSDVVYESLPTDDPSRRRPDISRARELLGWEPSVSLVDGLRRTAEYFGQSPSVDVDPVEFEQPT